MSCSSRCSRNDSLQVRLQAGGLQVSDGWCINTGTAIQSPRRYLVGVVSQIDLSSLYVRYSRRNDDPSDGRVLPKREMI